MRKNYIYTLLILFAIKIANAQTPTENWSTYFGGPGFEKYSSSFVDSVDGIYVAGETTSKNLSTKGAFQEKIGGIAKGFNYDIYYRNIGDGFVAKFNIYGRRIWCTYLGGRKDDYITKILTDNKGHIYICGYTKSDNFYVSNSCHQDKNLGQSDGYIMKMDTAGKMIWSTYFGGSGNDYILDLGIDTLENK